MKKAITTNTKAKKTKPDAKKQAALEAVELVEDIEIIEDAVPADEIIIIEESKSVAKEINMNAKVGDILRKKRIELGKKIPEVSKVLCIRKVYLEAIEASNYPEIPEFPYGPGFIRSYGDYLGLDGTLLVEMFKKETNMTPDVREEEDLRIETEADTNTPNKKYLVISIASILVLYFAWFLFNSANNEEEIIETEIVDTSSDDMIEFPIQVQDYADIDADDPIIEAGEITVETTPAPVQEISSIQEVVPTPAVVEEKPAEVAVQEIETDISVPSTGIFLVAKEEVWVEVRDYEKLYLSKVLLPGDTYKVPNRADMILSAGVADALDVYVDGVITPVITPRKKLNIDLNEFLKR